VVVGMGCVTKDEHDGIRWTSAARSKYRHKRAEYATKQAVGVKGWGYRRGEARAKVRRGEAREAGRRVTVAIRLARDHGTRS
jgi:hypothetical protein